ncbi:MAG: GtrA family protein [Oscillospiraceae bacterium]|nr:GtrA family protein [Oscillospiraceae bacterium]
MSKTNAASAWKRLDKKLEQNAPERWKLVKFFITATIASAPEFGSYMLLLYGMRSLGVERLGVFGFMEHIVTPRDGFPLAAVVYAYMISTAIGYATAFAINRKSTFKADSNAALSIFLYVLMVIFTIFANSVIGPVISGFMGASPLPSALNEVISKLLSMAIPALWSYPLNRFVIHRKKKTR